MRKISLSAALFTALFLLSACGGPAPVDDAGVMEGGTTDEGSVMMEDTETEVAGMEEEETESAEEKAMEASEPETSTDPAPETSSDPVTETTSDPVTEPASDPVTETPSEPETTAAPEVKSFTMTAKRWEFVPSTITVNEGDTVRLVVTSTDVEHGIALPQFGVNETLPPNQTVTVQFVADKAGTYTFFCNVFCGSGHGSMKGTLVVQ